tara:strand:- start:326 stop:1081 length:756 start_codon:yes stop_codon:yes gene_type:complete
MNNKYWVNEIKNNFNNAARKYSNYSFIQKYFANKLISIIEKLEPPKGKWLDLGSGTGFLADLIENKLISNEVIRIDFSSKMLFENKKDSKTILWDLNLNLPPYIDNAAMIISCFSIHWLNEPERAIQHWFNKLVPGGFLIVLFPTNKSFPEWKETCNKCKIEYSGLTFPREDLLKSLFKVNEIYNAEEYDYIETFPNIYRLFKSMINVGAQSSKSKRKTISELKLMQREWPKDDFQKVNLSWNIKILILKK